jgi:hypothetical protein
VSHGTRRATTAFSAPPVCRHTCRSLAIHTSPLVLQRCYCGVILVFQW